MTRWRFSRRDFTDWDVFRAATNSLDEYTEAVTSYISFCEDCCVPSRTRVSYNNDKHWFTAKLRRLRLDKEEAFWSGDKDRFKEAKYKFIKAVKEAYCGDCLTNLKSPSS